MHRNPPRFVKKGPDGKEVFENYHASVTGEPDITDANHNENGSCPPVCDTDLTNLPSSVALTLYTCTTPLKVPLNSMGERRQRSLILSCKITVRKRFAQALDSLIFH